MKSLSKEITLRDKYDPAMKIRSQEEADEYFEACVQHCMLFEKSREEADTIERNNLGYYAGYYGEETRQRVDRLFGAPHPIFGRANPSPQEALNQGRQQALQNKKRSK